MYIDPETIPEWDSFPDTNFFSAKQNKEWTPGPNTKISLDLVNTFKFY